MEIAITICSVLGVSSIISAFINRKLIAVYKRQEEQELRQKAVENGMQALLRANIISIYNKYMERGYVPIYERENIDHLYKEYKTLGGNGVVESLIEKLDDLPTPRHSDSENNSEETYRL